jgi:hypothetical protein
MRVLVPAFAFLLLSACGGSAAPAKSAEAPEPAAKGDSAKEDAPAKSDEAKPASAAGKSAPSAGVPTECYKGNSSPCVPDRRFIERMCGDSFPTIALYLFGNGNPFSKGYLTRRTQAWNAEGGASDNSWLEFDEEVLVLAERGADKGGMQVSGAGGSYMALRWNGSCVTLAKEEMTLSKPPSPKAAKVEWRFLDDNVQEALRADSTINEAVIARRKECKGAVSGDVSLKCVKADDKLSAVIVDYLRRGGKIPVPSKLPK